MSLELRSSTIVRAITGLVLATLLATYSVSITGCSLLGLGIGTLIDHNIRATPPRVLAPGEARLVKRGAPVALVLRDSARVLGLFDGRGQLDPVLYAARYQAWRETTSLDAPALGETLTVVARDGREVRAPFAGFGWRELRLQTEGSKPPVRFAYEELARVRREAEWVPISEWVALDANHALPTYEALRMIEGDPRALARLRPTGAGITETRPKLPAPVLVPANDVAMGILPRDPHFAQTFLIIGLATDAFVVVTLASFASQGPWFATSGCEGYSPDGYIAGTVVPTTRPYDVARGAFVEPGNALAASVATPGR